MPPFARRCRQAADKIWGRSFKHPFVQRLKDGTLDSERFRYYLLQDARYLEACADVCSLISTKIVDDPEDKLWWIEAAKQCLSDQAQLEANWGKKMGYGPKDVRKVQLSPSHLAYQSHLLGVARQGDLVECVAAFAPYPWLYTELGKTFEADISVLSENPYADHLRSFVHDDLNEYMQTLLAKLQKYADRASEDARRRAVEAFVLSCRYDWMFWQQAWDLEKW